VHARLLEIAEATISEAENVWSKTGVSINWLQVFPARQID
jgi:hypothetical protein